MAETACARRSLETISMALEEVPGAALVRCWIELGVARRTRKRTADDDAELLLGDVGEE